MRGYDIARAAAMAAGLLLALGGCGGGGGGGDSGGQVVAGPGPTTPPANTTATPQGLWVGTLSNNRDYNIYVLDDSSVWIFYTTGPGQGTIRGLMQGNGTASTANFTATNLRDFDFVSDAVNDGQLSAAYQTRVAFGGQITYPSNTPLNVSIPITGGVTNYSSLYDATPVLADLVGNYGNGLLQTVGADQFAAVSVGSNGGFSVATAGGCAITGTITPRTRGNVFSVQGQVGAAPCVEPGSGFSGVAFFLPRRADGQKQITIWWTNATRSNATVVAATRP